MQMTIETVTDAFFSYLHILEQRGKVESEQ